MTPSWLDLNADETAEDVVLPVEVRVKQGMALLDEKHGPGWVWRIDVDTLDLSGACSCVVGQLYRRHDADEFAYETGAYALLDGNEEEEVRHGFERDKSFDYPALTVAWKHAILARRMEQEATT